MPQTAQSLTAAEVREQFITFFKERASHTFVPSSPVVPHDDPTLLFANAGMNQFKPVFLDALPPGSPLEGVKRAVNSQKCIRAGGKHNDLDDVGKDSYHHTFFEMLGNWSFGDYFKAEAIQWAWELLTDIWGVDPERLYATYFEGDPAQGLDPDHEARDFWLKYLPEDRVLPGNMKDNFWEMGDTGPCGPCSELHYDGRPDTERAQTPGRDLVNQDHDQVIEIWNLVFIQFDRSPDALKPLPAKHVDTGMGLERIVRVLQGKTSNYDTDVFTPLFEAIQRVTGSRPYSGKLDDPIDTAYRVIADHIRTLCFAIADGAEPSNEGRGYVLRRILRRAVRYGRQTLNMNAPFFAALVPTVVKHFGDAFPELREKEPHITSTIADEEESFLRTLAEGLRLFDEATFEALKRVPIRPSFVESLESDALDVTVSWLYVPGMDGPRVGFDVLTNGEPEQAHSIRCNEISSSWLSERFESTPSISAEDAFRLYDTHGFPLDLTQLMAEERGMTVDTEGFHRLMEEARERSRGGKAGEDDPIARVLLGTEQIATLRAQNVKPTDDSRKFTSPMCNATVRAIWNGTDWDETSVAGDRAHDKPVAIILDKTNFYAEMGGQLADTGTLTVTKETSAGVGVGSGGSFKVEAVRRCGEYVVHIGRTTKNEIRVGDVVEARIDRSRRQQCAANHTATHLLNLALREVLQDNADQRGSLVAPDRLRFDFTHNKPITPEQAERIEQRVNQIIEDNATIYSLEAGLEEAKAIHGVRAVFGEAYPDPVRLVSVGIPVEELLAEPEKEQWGTVSVELCGGTHVARTGEAKAFTITAEENVSKGVRRVVALTGDRAEEARAYADKLRSRVEGAAELPDKHLASEVQEFSSVLDVAEIPVSDKAALRTKLSLLADRAKSAQKQAAKAGREAAVDAAREIADRHDGTIIVAPLPGVGTDRQGLMSAMDAIIARRPDAAVMLFGIDEADAKIAIAAKVPEALIKQGLKAGDWVRAASQACGGKGGGRPDSAQGGGTDPTKLEDAMSAAKDAAASAIES